MPRSFFGLQRSGVLPNWMSTHPKINPLHKNEMEETTVRRKLPRIALAVLILGSLAISETTFSQQTEVTRSVPPAAKVGDEVISLEEVHHALHGQLAQIERQRYNLLSQQLEQLIVQRLLVQEAKKRGVTVEQLLREELYAKVPNSASEAHRKRAGVEP